MAFSPRFEVEGLQEVLVWTDTFPIRTRAVVGQQFEEWGREMVSLGANLSPHDKLRLYDTRRRPESEAFYLQWRHQVQAGEDNPTLEVGNVDPKMPVIIGPTQPRDIQAKGDHPMRFYWLGGPEGIGPYFAWQVHHPGTSGQPVHEWILDAFDIDRRLGGLAEAITAG